MDASLLHRYWREKGQKWCFEVEYSNQALHTQYQTSVPSLLKVSVPICILLLLRQEKSMLLHRQCQIPESTFGQLWYQVYLHKKMHLADSAADPLLKLNPVLYAATSIANKDKIQSKRSAVPTTNLLTMLHFGRNLWNSGCTTNSNNKPRMKTNM